MAEVTLSIAGRNYTVSCRDGEEPHLRLLADRVDRKATEARAAVGDTSEPRLLLLSALLLADELHETGTESVTMVPSTSLNGLAKIADALERIATKVES